ncbi:b(0,+)-type amino acid transporter 1 [Ceratocystis fimbriata CBS 114723]|uniref:B(0,+)-type amino acid transporter 1 n=1 Tax=Ceratocystis fimbriata CBS 114723 TaxID=1035309 RepID=A0A2C5X8J9_9PEZI|nr:b(0,+)-type amino acid transporter 1 [Ceratocystis fimbriata CBS 114723]
MADLDSAAQQPLLAESQSAQQTHDAPPYGTTTRITRPDSDRDIGRQQPTLGAIEAFGILISIVIGSGIFTSPGSIDTNVPSPGASLVVWLVGGLLAWTGASTVAELGTAIPGEGGVQPYLQYIYGDVFGFLAAWTWTVAVMPATLAILSIVFVDSIFSALNAAPAVFTLTADSMWLMRKCLSVAILMLVSLANCISTKASTRLNNFFVVAKFASIAFVVLAGLAVVVVQVAHGTEPIEAGGHDWSQKPWFAARISVNPDGSETDWTRLSQWELLGHYSAALYGALWAYSGWDKAVYVSAELRDPVRQLPLAINTAIPTIIFAFIAAIASYYVLLPWNEVSTTDSVAVTAIARLFGPGIGLVASVMICLVVAGSLLGNSFVAGRMAMSAAHKGWFPHCFGTVGRLSLPSSGTSTPQANSGHDRSNRENTGDAPINAIGLATLLAAFYIVFGNFRALITFNGLGEFTFFFLTVVGAVILRFREPSLNRPYKLPIAVPVIFSLVSGFVVARGAIFAPAQAAMLIVLWALGVAYYLVCQWRAASVHF